MDEMLIEQNKAEFIAMYNKYVNRKGKEQLLEYIEGTDFFTAPASMKNHLDEPGGLCVHSINVAKLLIQTMMTPGTVWHSYAVAKGITRESCVIVGLLHDLCKVKYYSAAYKSQKNYDPNVVAEALANGECIKRSDRGDYVWREVSCYEINDVEPLGHGEHSLMRILENGGLELTLEEKLAIRWHMGFTIPKDNWSTLNRAMDVSPFIMAVNFADITATHLMEVPENKNLVLMGNQMILEKKAQAKAQAEATSQSVIPQQNSVQNHPPTATVQQSVQMYPQGMKQEQYPKQNDEKSFENFVKEMGNGFFVAQENPFSGN